MHMPVTPIEDFLKAGVSRKDAESYAQGAANTKIFAELSTLSISSARSVFPVRRLGESHVKDYTRGARTIAGTMVFALLDRDVFAELYRDNPKELIGGAPFFVDQIPEFNIFIAGANEYGGTISAGLVGITLTNCGMTLSVDDIYTEVTYTYVAQHFFPVVADYTSFKQLVKLQETFEAQLRAASKLLLPTGTPIGSIDENEETQLDRAMKESENILLSSSRI
jgi:hypothetical protein